MISVNLIASAGFYAGLRLIDQAYFLLRRRHGMGQGDAKLMAAGALWIDPYDIGLCLLIAVASAVISASLIALFQRRLKKESAIPFGPHLAFSLWHCFLFALHS